MRGLGMALAALTLLLAGCLGAVGNDEQVDPQVALDPEQVGHVRFGELSQPVHELESVVETFLPSHDGTELHAVEYHPDVEDGVQTPVVIQLSPYFGNLDQEAQAAEDDYFVELLVERGYTVVYASVRGTGYSGGCYQLGGPTEIQDAYELVERYHEADWSNGNVSLIGVSYPGTTPWQAAITDPPGLKTIVPIEGISDMYRYDHINGASYTHGPAFPTYYTVTSDYALVPQNAREPGHVLGPLGAACPGVAERWAAGYETLASGDHDAFWDERDYEAQVTNISVPVFLVHGFQDWNVDPDNGIPLFKQLPVGSKAWLGQWAHNIPFSTSGPVEADRHDWNLTLVAWFDEHLKGKDTGIMDEPAVLAQTSQGPWHRADTWPPAGTEPRALHLTATGELTDEPGQAGTLTMGPYPGGVTDAVVLDESPVPGLGPDHLSFTSQPLAEDTLIVGQPTLTLNLSIDAEDGHLVAELWDLDAEENALVGHAILNLAHRDSRDAGEPMTPGQTEQINLTFYPLDALVPEGHQLELVLQPEDTSRIHVSPHTPAYTFELGGDRPATLAYDVLPAPVFEQAPDQDEVPWGS